MSFGEKLDAALAEDRATSSTLKILLTIAAKPGKDCAIKPLIVNKVSNINFFEMEHIDIKQVIIWCTGSDITCAK